MLPNQESKSLRFKGLNLDATFDTNVVPTFQVDHKKTLVVVKVEKLAKQLNMEICMIKGVDFDFDEGDSSSEFGDIRFAFVHHPIRVILPREAQNVDFIDGLGD